MKKITGTPSGPGDFNGAILKMMDLLSSALGILIKLSFCSEVISGVIKPYKSGGKDGAVEEKIFEN